MKQQNDVTNKIMMDEIVSHFNTSLFCDINHTIGLLKIKSIKTIITKVTHNKIHNDWAV